MYLQKFNRLVAAKQNPVVVIYPTNDTGGIVREYFNERTINAFSSMLATYDQLFEAGCDFDDDDTFNDKVIEEYVCIEGCNCDFCMDEEPYGSTMLPIDYPEKYDFPLTLAEHLFALAVEKAMEEGRANARRLY